MGWVPGRFRIKALLGSRFIVPQRTAFWVVPGRVSIRVGSDSRYVQNKGIFSKTIVPREPGLGGFLAGSGIRVLLQVHLVMRTRVGLGIG